MCSSWSFVIKAFVRRHYISPSICALTEALMQPFNKKKVTNFIWKNLRLPLKVSCDHSQYIHGLIDELSYRKGTFPALFVRPIKSNLDVVKGLLVGDVIDQDHSCGSPVVRPDECPEPETDQPGASCDKAIQNHTTISLPILWTLSPTNL